MLLSWRMLLSSPVLVMLAALGTLGTLGTAIELYDDVSPGDMALMYSENNYIDTGPVGPVPRYEDPIKSVLLYKMLNSFRNRDVSPSILSGPKWIPLNPALVPPDNYNLLPLKTPLVKREPDAKIAPKETYKYANRPQQKWKIKKGKSGSQMICYFKLCAFRSPL